MTKSTTSSRYKFLCELLQQARLEKEMTQRELARKLEKPHSFVSKYETRARRLDPVELLDVTEALEMDACKLLKQIAAYPKAEKRGTIKKH